MLFFPPLELCCCAKSGRTPRGVAPCLSGSVCGTKRSSAHLSRFMCVGGGSGAERRSALPEAMFPLPALSQDHGLALLLMSLNNGKHLGGLRGRESGSKPGGRWSDATSARAKNTTLRTLTLRTLTLRTLTLITEVTRYRHTANTHGTNTCYTHTHATDTRRGQHKLTAHPTDTCYKHTCYRQTLHTHTHTHYKHSHTELLHSKHRQGRRRRRESKATGIKITPC